MSDKVTDIILDELKILRKDIKEVGREVTNLSGKLAESNKKMEGINVRVMAICAIGGSLVTALAEILSAMFIKTGGQ